MVLACALGAALIALSTWLGYWAGYRTDEYQLILLGKTVYDGGRMYVDCWENKPPGIAWINAAAVGFSGGGQLGAWVLPGIVAAAAIGVFGVAVGRRWGRLAGGGSIILAAVVYSLRLYNTPSINPDFYSSILELAALAMCLLGASRAPGGRLGRWVLCVAGGLFWVGAATVKVTALLSLGAMGLAAFGGWWLDRKRARRAPLLSCGALVCVGIAFGTGVVVAVLSAQGTTAEAWHAAVAFNQRYAAVAGNAFQNSNRGLGDLYPLILPLWAATVGLTGPLRRDERRPSWALVAGLAAWWGAQAALIPLGPSGSIRYWQATFPPMLCLAAIGLWQTGAMWADLGGAGRGGLLALILPAGVGLGVPLMEGWKIGAAEAYTAYCEPVRERDRLKEIGAGIRNLVPRGEAIYVCAYDPGIYLYADRRPASRFTYPRSPEQVREIVAALKSGRPRLVLVPADWGAGPDLWGADWRIGVTAALRNYEQAGVIGPYNAWVPRKNATAVGSTSAAASQPTREALQ